MAMVLVVATVALADVVYNDLDATVDATLEVMNLEVGGVDGSVTMTVTADDSSDPVNGCNHRGPGGLVTLGVKSSNAAVATVSPSTIQFTACHPSAGSTAVVTVTPVADGSATISLSTATADGASLTTNSGATLANYNVAPAAFTVNVTTAAPANTAPTPPGKPAATPASPNQGGFTLDWAASTDDGLPNPPNALSYELQGKDADDADFSGVSSASALTTNSYTFASGPAEGTWTYRVRASDSALTSEWSPTSDPIVVDRTKPTFGACPAAGPFIVGGGFQSVGSIIASDPALPDGSPGSGINAAASTLSASVDTSTVGTKEVTFIAVDNAGNSETKPCSYNVQYGFVGFERPVENPSVMNVAKAGQAIPLKFRVVDASGGGISTLTSVSVTVQSLACAAGSTTDAVEEYAAGSSGLQNLGDGNYQFNWKTPTSYASSCKTMRLDLGDGVYRTALFQFRK